MSGQIPFTQKIKFFKNLRFNLQSNAQKWKQKSKFTSKDGYNLFFSMRFSHEVFHTTEGTQSPKVSIRLGTNPEEGEIHHKPTTFPNSPPLRCSNLFIHLRQVWAQAINFHQSPLSMGYSRQKNWNGLHFLFQGIFPTQGSNLLGKHKLLLFVA